MDIAKDKSSKYLVYYLLFTFASSILLSIYVFFGNVSESSMTLLRISAMFIPALAVLLMKIFFKDSVKNVGWNRFPIKWFAFALLLIPFVIHLINLPLVAFLNGMSVPWQEWLTADPTGIFHTPDSRGWGDLTLSGLIYRILTNAFVGLIIVSILAFFEEIGWRSWMLPRLIDRFNPKKAILISAVIWALWHIPFVFSGMNIIPGIPIIFMIILYPLGLIGAGIVLGWLWYSSRSIWIVCIAHGALNNWGQYAFKYMKDGTGDSTEWPWLYIGVNISLLLLGVVILFFIKNKSQNFLQ